MGWDEIMEEGEGGGSGVFFFFLSGMSFIDGWMDGVHSLVRK